MLVGLVPNFPVRAFVVRESAMCSDYHHPSLHVGTQPDSDWKRQERRRRSRMLEDILSDVAEQVPESCHL
eukprot:291861-Rhodomonas_salina.1